MKTLKEQLKHDKIKINWNKNPIKMDLFLSFLTVETQISYNHLGSDNGWTMRFNKDIKLEIGGGIVNGVNYLDRLQYGYRLSNAYNNFVNPFYLWDIMNEEGRRFFANYYKNEIDEIVKAQSETINRLDKKLKEEKENELLLEKEYNNLFR